MFRKHSLPAASFVVFGIATFITLRHSRAGVSTLHPSPVSPGVVTRTTTVASNGAASFSAPNPVPAGPPPDGAVLDRILAHNWTSRLYQNNLPRLHKEEIDAPYVALTFDDGPKPWGTPLVLDTLQKYNAHATFFLVGKQCQLYPALVSRIVSQGNEIGNHTYNHYRLPTIAPATVANELERNRTILRQLTGQTVYLFRPPGGRTNSQIQTIVDSLGYTTVFWQLDSGELAPTASPDRVYHAVVDQIKNGDIVLLHNGDPNIVMALPAIMQDLTARHFQFVTVTELMQLNGARAVSQPITAGAATE